MIENIFRYLIALEGFRYQFPDDKEDILVDTHFANEEFCPLCGSRMSYYPVRSESEYRAFAVCTDCKVGVEF